MDLLRKLLFLPPGASQMARDIDLLHGFVIGVSALGAFGVALATVRFVVKYRHRSGPGYTEHVGAPRGFELGIGGFLVALFILWWVLGYRQYGEIQAKADGALEIYVTGKQWMWKFAYPDGRSTAGYLVVPRNEPVVLQLTSRDVIHSFFVPAFRIKRDALPSRYTTISFEATRSGTYRAMCAEYCGTSHSRMWADVVVLSPPDYEQWLEGEPPAPVARAQAGAVVRGGRTGDEDGATLAERGREIAAQYGCLSCHTTDGQQHVGPTWAGLYGSHETLDDGQTVEVDADYITESMMRPNAKRVRGFDALMPTYQGELEGDEVAAVVAFIRSLRDAPHESAVELPELAPAAGTQPDGGGEGGAP